MDKRKTTIVVLIFIIFIGILYFFSINKDNNLLNNESIGYNYFPNILTILLISLCLISLFQTIKEKKDQLIVSNLKLFLLTLTLLILYLLSWTFIGLFYINTFIFLIVLLIIYQEKINLKKTILKSILISFVMTAIIYILFNQLMNIQF